MSSDAPAESRGHNIATGKDESRGTRLKVSNFLEEQVRKEWTGMARKSCDPLVKAYWLCRNDNGLGVIFKCRRQLADMNTCLGSWSSDPSLYEEYAAKRLPQLQGGFAAGKPNPKYFDEEGNRLVPEEFTKKPKSRH